MVEKEAYLGQVVKQTKYDIGSLRRRKKMCVVITAKGKTTCSDDKLLQAALLVVIQLEASYQIFLSRWEVYNLK